MRTQRQAIGGAQRGGYLATELQPAAADPVNTHILG